MRRALTPKSIYKIVTRYNKLISDGVLTEREEQIAKMFVVDGLNPREIEERQIVKGKRGLLGRDMIQLEINKLFGDIILYAEPFKNVGYRRQRRTNEELNLHYKMRRKMITDNHDACCAVCGSKDNLQLDHIITVSAGGKTEESNLQVLCKKCHREKTEQETKQFGWRNNIKRR